MIRTETTCKTSLPLMNHVYNWFSFVAKENLYRTKQDVFYKKCYLEKLFNYLIENCINMFTISCFGHKFKFRN